jgi:hypothetical protein
LPLAAGAILDEDKAAEEDEATAADEDGVEDEDEDEDVSPHSSQMQTMRSSEQEANTCPNSGCAHDKRQTLFWCGARGKSKHCQSPADSLKSQTRIFSLEQVANRLP